MKAFIARLLGAHRDERHWRVGAEGEEEVAWRLRKLGKGWHVIHSVPVGDRGSDIDHVVIGPGGVFTLNTKNHTGQSVSVTSTNVFVNGQNTHYFRNSRFEAERAARLLAVACNETVAVHPVIVVMAAQLTIKAQPPDVSIVARKSVAQWLSRRPAVMTPQRVEEIFEYARRDTTWRGTQTEGR
jgi:Nuclease-related domain